MFQFSVSSFLDLLNSIACFILALKLRRSYLRTLNASSWLFYLFYLTFGIFFLFLSAAFFVPSRPGLVQLFFVIAHLFLYFAMTIILSFIFRLFGRKELSRFVPAAVAVSGLFIFVMSLNESAQARQYSAMFLSFPVISWSHGGAAWIRLVVGISGSVLGAITGVWLLIFTKKYVENDALVKKSKYIGVGLIILGLAACIAFVFSVFDFYDFWIVLSAEIVTMIGLVFIYKALANKYQ